jgi:hypothetical protein
MISTVVSISWHLQHRKKPVIGTRGVIDNYESVTNVMTDETWRVITNSPESMRALKAMVNQTEYWRGVQDALDRAEKDPRYFAMRRETNYVTVTNTVACDKSIDGAFWIGAFAGNAVGVHLASRMSKTLVEPGYEEVITNIMAYAETNHGFRPLFFPLGKKTP